MPKNPRPGGIFGDMDYGWQGTTLNERIQAQNQWDLLAEQEKSNEIAREKLQLEKEKFEYMKQKDLKQNDEKKNKNIDDFKYSQLCNLIGIQFYELEALLKLFFNIIEYGNIELIKKIEEIQNSNDEQDRYKLQDLLEENENYKETIYVNFLTFRVNHYNRRMENLFKELKFNIVTENDEDYEFTEGESEYFTFKGSRTCTDVFNEINEDRGTEKDYIEFIKKFNEKNGLYSEEEQLCDELNINYSIVKQFYDLLLDIKTIAKKKYDEWHDIRVPEFVKEIEDNQPLIRANREIKECYDNGIRILPNILSNYLFLSRNDIDDINECPEDIKEILYARLNDFNNFRYNNYNKEVELLFQKLKLEGIEKLNLNNVIAEGSIDSYVEYMNNYVKSMKGDI